MKVFRIICIATSSLLLTFLLLFSVLKWTLFDEKYLEKVADRSGYHELVAAEVNKAIQNIGIASGLPEEVLVGVVSEEDTKESSDAYFKYIYGEEKPDIETTVNQLVSNIETRVADYAVSQDMTVVDHSENQLSQYAKNIYEKSIELPYMTSFGQKIITYQKYLNYGLVATGILFVVFIGLLGWACARYAHQWLRYISYMLSSSGLIFIVFPSIVLLSGILSRIALTTESVYVLFLDYVNGCLKGMLMLGGIALVLSVLCSICSEVSRKNLIHSKRKKR